MKKIVAWYIVWALILLMFIGYSQFKTTSIEQIKNDDNYFGSVVTVEGYFVCDSMLMLVTDCAVYTVNTRMPWDQYILLTGDKTKYMFVKTCDKVRVKGVVGSVIIPTGTGFFYPELAIEVTQYRPVPSAWHYFDDNRRKCVIKTGPKMCIPEMKLINTRRSKCNTWLIYGFWGNEEKEMKEMLMKYLLLLFMFTSIIFFVGLVECKKWKENEKYWLLALLVSVSLFFWVLIKIV